jgi:hypothetical protein
MCADYVRYEAGIESPADDEPETIASIIESMASIARMGEKRYGQMLRPSHAKAFGVLVGQLRVHADLPPELGQGLFAAEASYPVVARMAHVPGELLDDSRVSTPRGLSLKVLGVPGAPLKGHTAQTQDFVLDTGKVFPSPGPNAFLATIKTLEAATPVPEGIKHAVSAVMRATTAGLAAVGIDAPNPDFFGHPRKHPLKESYFSQVPLRYGDYIAKLAVVPRLAAGEDPDAVLDVGKDPDALRHAVGTVIQQEGARFDVRVQLCRDIETMPIENAHAEWPEDLSPYRTVATLVFPPQDAFSPARAAYVEHLGFSPAHSLEAHRPIGGINRARLRAYPEIQRLRASHHGRVPTEPTDIGEVPD